MTAAVRSDGHRRRPDPRLHRPRGDLRLEGRARRLQAPPRPRRKGDQERSPTRSASRSPTPRSASSRSPTRRWRRRWRTRSSAAASTRANFSSCPTRRRPLHAAATRPRSASTRSSSPVRPASVWSAFGISQADIRYQYESSVVLIEPFDPGAVKSAFDELYSQAREALGEREDVDAFAFRRYARIALPVAAPRAGDELPAGEIDARRWRRSNASSSRSIPNATARSRCFRARWSSRLDPA